MSKHSWSSTWKLLITNETWTLCYRHTRKGARTRGTLWKKYLRVAKKQTGPWGMPTGFCFSKQLQFGVCGSKQWEVTDACSALTDRGKQAMGAKNAVSSSSRQPWAMSCPHSMLEAWNVPECNHESLLLTPSPLWWACPRTKAYYSAQVTFSVIPGEPKLFSELTTLKKSFSSHYTGGHSWVWEAWFISNQVSAQGSQLCNFSQHRDPHSGVDASEGRCADISEPGTKPGRRLLSPFREDYRRRKLCNSHTTLLKCALSHSWCILNKTIQLSSVSPSLLAQTLHSWGSLIGNY